MAFVPGLSKSQVVKVINDYANLAPATMQLIDDLSAQINDPNDPAAALIARMTVAESDIDINESSISTLSSTLSTKAPSDNPTLSNPTLTGTVTLPDLSITNSKLVNSAISINGTSVPLGGNVLVTGTALPSQTDNAGKALVTDGSSLSWQTVDVSTLNSPTINSPTINTPGLTYGQSNFGYVDAYNIRYYNMGPVPSIGETVKFINYYDENDYFTAVVDNVTYPYGGTFIFQLTINSQSGTLAGFDNAKTYSAIALPVSIESSEISKLNGLTDNVQTKLNSLSNDIKFDFVSISSELDNVAVMLLSSGGVNYYQANDPNTTAITVELANAISGVTYDYLNSAMTVGKAATFVLMIKNGATTASYPGTITIPAPTSGTTTVRWQGGTAPTSGNLNAVDIYTFTVVKLDNHVFDVFADVAKFA